MMRAMCCMMMVYLASDVHDAELYLEECREAFEFNVAIGRSPPGSVGENDMADCEAYIQDRRDHPENYDPSDDEDGDLSHEAWLRFYYGDDPSTEAASDDPSAEHELDRSMDAPMVATDDVDNADDNEEEPAALPTSDARFARSSSRPAEDDSATSAFDPQSDAPYGFTDAPDESEQ
jgi:hypothetical protein